MIKKAYDVVICGGGVMGSSIAYHLSTIGVKNILVIEKDNKYQHASCVLSAGGMRQQFSLKENIMMATYGTRFLQTPELLRVEDEIPDYQFHQNGYLFLASEKGVDSLMACYNEQQQCGADWIKLLSNDQMQQKFPWLKVSDITLGSFGERNEGYFDPWTLLNAFKKKAISNGVNYTEGVVTGCTVAPNSSMSIDKLHVQAKGGDYEVGASTVVNACGAFAGHLLKSFEACAARQGINTMIAPLPVKARKRSIFMFQCSDDNCPPSNTPLTIDTSGVYFRPEGKGGRFICGVSPTAENDPDHDNLEPLAHTDEEIFYTELWEKLAARVPAFEQVKLRSSWSGYYEFNTLDENAIIGFHPNVKNLMLCNGFSGHGLMQSPAAGRAVSELLTSGRFQTIDLSRFSYDRVANNAPIPETCII